MSENPNYSAENLRDLPMRVTWTHDRREMGESFEIHLQDEHYVDIENRKDSYDQPVIFPGVIERDDQGNTYMDTDTMSVVEELRGDRPGERLRLGERAAQAMASLAVEQECKYIKVGFAHAAALNIFRKIYGDERIHYYPRQESGQDIAINDASDAAAAILRERQHVVDYGVTSRNGMIYQPKTIEEVGPGAIKPVDAWINLDGFDASAFEPPVQRSLLPGQGYY
jgi:hypothetical protein